MIRPRIQTTCYSVYIFSLPVTVTGQSLAYLSDTEVIYNPASFCVDRVY